MLNKFNINFSQTSRLWLKFFGDGYWFLRWACWSGLFSAESALHSVSRSCSEFGCLYLSSSNCFSLCSTCSPLRTLHSSSQELTCEAGPCWQRKILHAGSSWKCCDQQVIFYCIHLESQISYGSLNLRSSSSQFFFDSCPSGNLAYPVSYPWRSPSLSQTSHVSTLSTSFDFSGLCHFVEQHAG